jgi:protein SHQ1
MLPPANLWEFSDSELISAMTPSYRRSVAFPLYRSFALAEMCRQDVAGLMSKGKRVVVRCLLEIKHILDHHEVYYVYSKIWVDDLCAWIQTYGRYVPFSLHVNAGLFIVAVRRYFIH